VWESVGSGYSSVETTTTKEAMKTYKGYGGAIELHDDHLMISREGRLAKSLGLGATREIPLTAITGVTLKQASMAVNGYIQLQLGGDPPRDRQGDPNAVIFTHKHRSEFEELAGLLQSHAAKNAEAGIDAPAVEVDRGASRLDRLRGTGHANLREAPDQTGVDAAADEARVEAVEPSKRDVRRGVRQEAKAAQQVEKAEAKRIRDEAKALYMSLANRDTVKAGNMIPGMILDVEGSRLITEKGAYPLSSETTVNVVAGGDIAVRSTGLLGWGSQAHDNRTLILQTEDARLGWALTLPAKPKDEFKTRGFAQRVGLAVAALAPTVGDTPASASSADELRKLAELFNAGALSENEFGAAKARILGL
jgi:Short C-terminal domain/Domain of unknown function (DUF4429)